MNSLDVTSVSETKSEDTTEFNHDEDTWLFSSEKKGDEESTAANVPAVDSVEDINEISSHDFSESVSKEEGEKSDEDDDEIDVRIDELDPSTASHSAAIRGNQPQNVFQKAQNKGVDLDTPGNINGVTTYDYDLNQIKDEDKPWRKPGADITDYFNYGFNEETWMLYCLKQRRLRAENSQYSSQKPNVVSNPSLVAQIFKTKTITNAKRLPASIDVIGTTDQTSRRQNGSFDESVNLITHPFIQPPIHPVMPDLSTPPPGYQCPPGIISPAVGSRSIPPVRHPVQQFFPLPVPRIHERPPAPQSYGYPFPRPPQAYTMWENPNAEHFRYDNARSRSRSSSNPRSKNGRSDSLERHHDSHSSRRGGSGDERENRYRPRRSRDRPSARYNDHSSSRNRDDRGSSRSDRRSRRSRDDSRRRRHRDDDRHSHRRHDRRRKKSYHSDDSDEKKKSKKTSKRSKHRTKSKERRSSRASSSTIEKRMEKSVEPKSFPPEE